MTLLTVCSDVADMVGVSRPNSIVASLNQQQRQLLGFAKETLEELSLMDWPVLCRAVTLPTVVNQQTYSLPSDFEHEIGDTLYIANKYEQLRGSLSPGDWARQRNSNPDIGRYRFRIYGTPLKLNVSPIPQVVESLVYEYKTNNRVVHADGSYGTTYTADTDLPLVPEELVKKGLKWRYRRAEGLDYSEEFNDYEMSRSSRLAQQLQFGSMPVAVRSPFDMYPLTDGYVPQQGFG